MIPPTIHPNVQSNAERKLFQVIRDSHQTDDWICLHSLGLAKHSTKRRGEIDFLLLTRKGIFVLEVKGGRVRRENGVWCFTDRYGTVHQKYESPFDQASSSMFSLEEYINNEFHQSQKQPKFLFGFGAIFPDIIFDAHGTEVDQQQIYDARDRRLPITAFIDRLASYWRKHHRNNRHAPNVHDIEELADFLRGDFDLVPPLSVVADAAADQLLSLEKEQYAILDSLEQYSRPRMLVQGSAGTGKTLLAVEVALRQSRKPDNEVLLLCYNRLLANFLQAKINADNKGCSGIVVKSIYSLMHDLIASSSLFEEFQSKFESSDENAIYSELFPEYAGLAVIETAAKPFNTLIIDEAQDMMTQEILDVLDNLIQGGFEGGCWWVFCDTNNQASVFGTFDEQALGRLLTFGNTAILSTNWRNTRPIADETIMLTRPKVRASARVDGIPVKYSWYEKPQLQSASLIRILNKLVKEQVTPGQITVLSPKKADICCASSSQDIQMIHITENNVWEIFSEGSNKISYASISSFKGLENDFIVLTDIDNLDTDWCRAVIYVGMSRARLGLYLLLKQTLRPVYEQCLKEWMLQHS